MTKLKKHDYINLSVLILFFLAIVLFLTRFKFVYGSTVDWQNQHWALPEYFRTLFYENHDFFPSFALNLGGGQNIYNFSYYGLLSPEIMLSYLFPFIDMMDYIIIISILTVIASVVLLYKWLHNNNYSSNICFMASFMFLCAGPIIFHSHKHIMFINYLPFLMLALIGVDRYLRTQKSLMIIISTFLMIMTSFFYSVGGIIVILLYSLYKVLINEPEAKFKAIFIKLFKISIRLIISVIMSCVLLLPTAMALLSGRNGVNEGKGLFDFSTFIPSIRLINLLYDPFSIGLTSIAILAIICGFNAKKKEKIMLSLIISLILIFPVFILILNGTLYIDPKTLIPFLPLMCIIIANFFDDLFKNYAYKKRALFIFVLVGIVGILSFNIEFKILYFAFFVDVVTLIIAVIISCKKKKKIYICIQVITFCIISTVVGNFCDKLLPIKDKDNFFSPQTQSLINSITDEDKNFYRFSNQLNTLSTVNKIYSTNYYQTTLYSSIYNKGYNKFYFDVFNNEINYRNSVLTNSTQNVLFNMLMGNKYMVTDKEAPIGYKFVKSNGKASVYKNDNVFPLGYATNKLMSENNFDKIKYPYSDEALMNYGIINSDCTDDFKPNMKEFTPEINSMTYKNLVYKEENGYHHIIADNKATMTLKLNEAINNKVVLIEFNMLEKSSVDDTYIFINGVKNKLTATSWKYRNNNYVFDYVISSNTPIEQLDIVFKNGDYKINGIKTYLLDYNSVKSIKNNIDSFKVDMNRTKGDMIAGKINVNNDGYFILNIPYDKGFNIKVDNKKVDYEKVNKTFIGFKIDKGMKHIEITYKAPLQKQGIILSIIGIISALSMCVFEYFKRKKASKSE